jgi:hypothetical protein
MDVLHLRCSVERRLFGQSGGLYIHFELRYSVSGHVDPCLGDGRSCVEQPTNHYRGIERIIMDLVPLE